GGDNGLLQVDPVLREHGLERVRGFQRAALDDIDERQVEAAGDAAASDAWSGLRDVAAEAVGGARVHHLGRTGFERRPHLVERGDEMVLEARREEARLRMSVARFQRPPLLDPSWQAAIEDAHILAAV